MPPASLDPLRDTLVGHVAAINSMTAMALRAAGVSMASGLALCAPAARQSVTLRSRDELEISKSVPGGPNRMSCGDFRNRAREHELVTSAFWSMTDGSVMGKVAAARLLR